MCSLQKPEGSTRSESEQGAIPTPYQHSQLRPGPPKTFATQNHRAFEAATAPAASTPKGFLSQTRRWRLGESEVLPTAHTEKWQSQGKNQALKINQNHVSVAD